MDIEATFTKLQAAVNDFVQNSNAWSRLVQKEAQSKTPLDQADSNAFDNLAKIEGDLRASVQYPPRNIEDLMVSFRAVDDSLIEVKDVYVSLAGVSATPNARGKENAARKSLKLLTREMNEVRTLLESQDGTSPLTAEPSAQTETAAVGVESVSSSPLAELFNRPVKSAKPLKVRGQVRGPSVGSAKALISGAAVHTSNLFLTTMNCLFQQQSSSLSYGITQQFIDITQLFFDNESFSTNTIYEPALSDSKIEGLTASWNAVIAVYADPSNAPDCIDFDPDDFVQQEAELFQLHDQLDTLYDHLETDIIRKSTSILLPNLP